MPNRDKTGPEGKGPKTGRQQGNCEVVEQVVEQVVEPVVERGRGMGCGNGRGRKIGMGNNT